MRWAAERWRLIAIIAGVSALLLVVYAAWARERALKLFGDPQLVRRLRDGSPAGWRATRMGMVLAAMVLAMIAAARPQGFAHSAIEPRKGMDIIVCLDVSKSMLARDVQPSRVARARTELRRLMEEEPGDRIGIVVFAGATMEYPLTTDHVSAERFMSEVEPWSFPVGGTSIGRAITAATAMFRRDPIAGKRTKVIIVITDGEDLQGDPVAAAREAAQLGAQVYVDAVGSTLPEPIPAFSRDGRPLNEFEKLSSGAIKTTQFTEQMAKQLEAVGREGKGQYFRASQGEVGIEKIRKAIQYLRRDELADTRRTVYDELMAWPTVSAILLLILAGLIPERIVRASRYATRPAWIPSDDVGAKR